MRARPWYQRYDEFRALVDERRETYLDRCRDLGVEPGAVQHEQWGDIIARIVHESNWQEGIFLDEGRTRELVDEVFADEASVRGPHMDFPTLITKHKEHVLRMRRQGASTEEIAALNLSRAHLALIWVHEELTVRSIAALTHCFRQIEQVTNEQDSAPKMPHGLKEALERGLKAMQSLETDRNPVRIPLDIPVATTGDLMKQLAALDFDDLLNPMHAGHLHFLHRISMMGIIHPRQCGRFRAKPVHVSNPDLFFPPPSTVPAMMEEFCKAFPSPYSLHDKDNFGSPSASIVKVAARVSHRFVRIHPYADGNGRMSRILMNLVLWRHHPPIDLKADKKGRHRYSQALRRADRGDLDPLAALIAMSLAEQYLRLIGAITPTR